MFEFQKAKKWQHNQWCNCNTRNLANIIYVSPVSIPFSTDITAYKRHVWCSIRTSLLTSYRWWRKQILQFVVVPENVSCAPWQVSSATIQRNTWTHTQPGASPHLVMKNSRSKQNQLRQNYPDFTYCSRISQTRRGPIASHSCSGIQDRQARYVEGCDLFRYGKQFICYAEWKEHDKVFSGRQPLQMNYKIRSFEEQLHLHHQGERKFRISSRCMAPC